jgi:hypothetical protein
VAGQIANTTTTAGGGGAPPRRGPMRQRLYGGEATHRPLQFWSSVGPRPVTAAGHPVHAPAVGRQHIHAVKRGGNELKLMMGCGGALAVQGRWDSYAILLLSWPPRLLPFVPFGRHS